MELLRDENNALLEVDLGRSQEEVLWQKKRAVHIYMWSAFLRFQAHYGLFK